MTVHYPHMHPLVPSSNAVIPGRPAAQVTGPSGNPFIDSNLAGMGMYKKEVGFLALLIMATIIGSNNLKNFLIFFKIAKRLFLKFL